MNYSELCAVVVEALRDNATGIGVESTSINEGDLGQLNAPPFIDCFFVPNGDARITHSGTVYNHRIEADIFVGVQSLDTLSASLRSGMNIVGKVLTVLESIGAEFSESSSPLELDSKDSDRTILRINCSFPYDPFVELEEG